MTLIIKNLTTDKIVFWTDRINPSLPLTLVLCHLLLPLFYPACFSAPSLPPILILLSITATPHKELQLFLLLIWHLSDLQILDYKHSVGKDQCVWYQCKIWPLMVLLFMKNNYVLCKFKYLLFKEWWKRYMQRAWF
jgi:hypothetical protein